LSEEHYPIRTVASLTGVNAITLRAWERRYGLIKPVRTESGHRLYSRADIDTIHRVTALLEKGVAIGQAREALAAGQPAAPRAAASMGWAAYRERMVAAIATFDEERLEELYNELIGLHPMSVVTDRVLLPLLVELGERWESRDGSVAEEHFFGVYLRNKLGARFHHRTRHQVGPKLMLACLEGEQHEFGLLLFALAAHDHGYQVVLLGANAPLGELAHAARRAHADAVVLSCSIEPSPTVLASELPALTAAATVPVFVGGLASVTRHDAIVAAGAEPLGADMHAGLRRLAERIEA
jgi:DNA-binding transcriptional MerR regulator/methylmalonyl-CoA mutase cobalamin-binding subunit